jgi:hypothetical protein
MKKTLLVVAVALLFSAGTSAAASLDVNANAALEGNFGLEVIMDGVADGAYVVENEQTQDEVIYRAQFLIDLRPGAVDQFEFEYALPQPTTELRGRAHHMIFSMKDLDQPPGKPRQHVSLHLKKFNDGSAEGRYKIWARTYEPTDPRAAGDGYVYSDHNAEAMEVNLPKDAGGYPVIVLFEWSQSGAGADNGTFSLKRATNYNPTLFEGKTHEHLSNDDKTIDQVELGAPSGVDDGSTGSYYLDSFESYRSLSTP